MAQGSPPRRPARLPAASRSARSGGSDRPSRSDRRSGRSDGSPWESDAFPADTDPDLPPWAGPSIYATRPGRRELRPPDEELPGLPAEGGGRARRRGRAAAARLRRSRRRVLIRGAVAVAIAIAAATVLIVRQQHTPAPAGDFVNTLQPGEFRAVPPACTSVSAGTLSQYVPGVRKVLKTIASSTQSQCSFTVDATPVFRVLEVTSQAYQPSLLPNSGNGSATANAIDSYFELQSALTRPPKRSPLPKARITLVAGLGQAALSALQVSHQAGGVTMDRVTVLARDRNALVQVVLQGQAAGGGFGPVSVTTLQAGALAAARNVLAGVAAGPTVGS